MSCAVIDFDGTLASFPGGPEEFFSIFEKQGVSKRIVKESYEVVRESKGFSIKNLYDELKGKGFSLDKDILENEFTDRVKRDLSLYKESMEAIENIQKQGMPVVILTAGEEVIQKTKVAITQISYDELIIVPRAKEKVAILTTLLKKYGKPLFVFDNRADILDLMREEFQDSSDVVTAWVHRESSDFPKGQYEHIEVKDLSVNSIARVIT
ncbi:MAG: hypothetical protein O3C23_00820 [bacterium]|nr:hypothetical protein [bacterium]